MANYLELEGRIKFAKGLFELDTFGDKQSWNIPFYPDNVQNLYDLLTEGVKNNLRKDDDGYHMIFRRAFKINTRRGEVTMSPPEVFGPEGEKLQGWSRIPVGAKAKLKLEIYEHNTPSGKKAKAARLHGATILELTDEVEEGEF